MKNLLIIIISVLIAASCSRNGHFASADEMVEHTLKTVKLIEPAELHQLMENYETYTLIDVRQELEHYPGFIPGTVNIPRGSLEFRIESEEFWAATGLYQPAKDELIILYCQKGQRSILAAESLQRLGYTNVRTLNGGWKNWELAYPDLYEKDLEKISGGGDKPKNVGSC